MKQNQRATLKALFNEWARNHPNPDIKAYKAEGRILNAQQINREVQNDTPCGKAVMLLVSSSMRGLTLAELNRSICSFKIK